MKIMSSYQHFNENHKMNVFRNVYLSLINSTLLILKFTLYFISMC